MKIIIVGGGIAGLTTAYYLSKNKELSVELYEADNKLGGRIKTVNIDGFKFNYGAFMIFPWYKSFNKLLNNLDYAHNKQHLDIDKEFSWDEDTHSFHRVNKFWTYDDAPVTTLLKTLPEFMTHKTELYSPDTSRFNHLTVEEYLRQLNPDDTRALDIVNKLIVGYTYGAISQLPMSIYFGFAKEILIHDGFKNVTLLEDGAESLIKALEEKLNVNGVDIHLSSKIEVNSKNELSINGQNVAFDYAVFATSYGNLINNFTPIDQPITYNDHYAAFITTKNGLEVNGNKDWNLVYTATMNEDLPQLTCIGNIERVFSDGPVNSYLTYLRIPNKMSGDFNIDTAKIEIMTQFRRFFPSSEDLEVKFIHHWEKTMPIISCEALDKLQSIQGENNIYFAGDYLGAPSMEVAVQSGYRVAELINKSYYSSKS